MRIVAALLSAWVAWRWLGFLLGAVRVFGFTGEPRREARRTVMGRGAYNVFFTVIVVYLWAQIWKVQPGETFVGFLAAAMMCSLAIAISAGFMQPHERTPATLDVCRVIRPRPSAEDTHDLDDGRPDDHDHEGREDAGEQREQ